MTLWPGAVNQRYFPAIVRIHVELRFLARQQYIPAERISLLLVVEHELSDFGSQVLLLPKPLGPSVWAGLPLPRGRLDGQECIGGRSQFVGRDTADDSGLAGGEGRTASGGREGAADSGTQQFSRDAGGIVGLPGGYFAGVACISLRARARVRAIAVRGSAIVREEFSKK